MNISTGGPHILFFERDQQLTALLTSEFQLAGYECHAARTAVEVFDTIARFPVRILLVNLAQAAAGRREFWVALDTQRRGRGVQVFTYLCSNLAGYGPRDTDERSQAQLADIEVDGMLGLMNLVDAVRERVPASGTTSTQTRLPKTPSPLASTTIAQQPTQTNMSGTTYRTNPIADTSHASVLTASVATQAPPVTPMQQSYSEKIRAVLYPTQRPVNAQTPAIQTDTLQSTQETERPVAYTYTPQQNVPQDEQNVQSGQNSQATQSYDTNPTALQRLAYGQAIEESGLDQLSRLLQERNVPPSNGNPNGVSYQTPNEVSDNRYISSTMQVPRNVPPIPYTSATQAAQSTDTIGTQPLRASPIEDLPLDRATSGASTSDGGRHSEGTSRTSYGQHGQTQNTQAVPTAQTTPLASISTLRTAITPITAKATMPIPVVIPPQKASVEKTSVQERPVTSPPTQEVQEERTVQQAMQEVLVEHNEKVSTGDLLAMEQLTEEEEGDEVEDTRQRSEQQEAQAQQSIQNTRQEQDTPPIGIAPNNAMLLDIVQSLPLMPSPPSAPQAVSGRTMRTLGSVLLEGHLVPQSRLEVAQNIQRMLRGVDLNYQLGEILLMFKLLTPDQLLAASLVSYGMISTQQISALGRIRQELHAIGLEYDLESLLILFRMLTPEQLREVRASWQA